MAGAKQWFKTCVALQSQGCLTGCLVRVGERQRGGPRWSYGVDGANTLIESRVDFTGKDVGAFIGNSALPPAEECS
jgi:hypothetical protein